MKVLDPGYDYVKVMDPGYDDREYYFVSRGEPRCSHLSRGAPAILFLIFVDFVADIRFYRGSTTGHGRT